MPKRKDGKTPKQARIEQQYGRPWPDVLKRMLALYGSITGASGGLAISRETMYRWMEEAGIVFRRSVDAK